MNNLLKLDMPKLTLLNGSPVPPCSDSRSTAGASR
jgi:hypothetical protein